ncbi:MAG: gliding motility-associated C-terminal domain-containing protein [Bacteroidia bacterium]|nr:gliding motility-associated C-terminal domain-containing protein [Bacteroidia bacterium]
MKQFILFLLILLLCFTINRVKGQCEVTGSTAATTIICGSCTYLSAFGQGQGQTIFSENFNTGTYGPGWSSTQQAMWNNPCSPGGVDGTTHLWMGNSSPVPRSISTQSYNLTGATAGVSICFDLMFAEQVGDASAAPCEGPDEPDEGVYIQYSTDGGATWTTIHFFDPNGGYDPELTTWHNWCFDLPPAAITATTSFRWFQDNDSGADYDHWGIDNVEIYFNDPTYQIIWQHDGCNLGATGGTDPTPVCPTTTTQYTVIMSNGTLSCTDVVTVNVVLPTIDVDVAQDTTLCSGSCVQFQGDASVIVSPAKTPTYENNEVSIVTSGNASVNINITDLNMTQVLPGSITQVCINAFTFSGTQICTNITGCNCNGTPISFGATCNLDISSFNVYLNSPTGCQILLIPQYEATGTMYQNVCFIPSGGQNISNPGFPTPGNWNPNQPFDNLAGCVANGVWSMEFNAPGGLGFGMGTFTGWSISFNDPEISYTGNFSWSPTTNMTGSNTLTPIVCPAATTTYTLTVSDTAGCTSVSDAATVTVNPCTFNVTVNSATICSGGCTNITATVSGGTAPLTYTWSTGGLSGPGPHNVCPSSTTTYTVTVTDAGSATTTASGTVTVNPLPTVNAGNDVSICSGNSTTLTASGASTYSWDNGLGAGSTHTVSQSSTTTTTYTVTGTDANGCTNTDQVTVTVNNGLAPVISGSLTFCTGSSTTLDAGSGYTSYLWSTNATSQTITVSAGGTYSVTVTAANGCTGNASVTVTQSSSLSPTITGPLVFCAGTSSTLDAGSGYATYSWSTGAASQTINVTLSGTYSVTVTDAGGCSGTDNVFVTANPNPSPAISGTLSICSGDSTALSTGTYTSYLWSTGATSQTIYASTSGSYSITVTDINGCTGSDNVSVTVNPNPIVTISGNLTFCTGSPTILDAGAGYSSYFWTTGSISQTTSVSAGGTYSVLVTNSYGCSDTAAVNVIQNTNPAPNITGVLSFCVGNSSTLDAGTGFSSYAWSTGATSQTIIVTTTGTYTVTITNANGCSGTDNVNVIVHPDPPPDITGNLSFCTGSSTSLSVGPFVSYQWSTGATSQTITVTSGGNYSVTITDVNGCSGSDAVTVTENANPSASIAGVLSFCSGGSSILDAGAGFSSYAWSTNETTQSVMVTTGGSYSVTVTNSNGCTNDTTVQVTVNPLPVPVITPVGPTTFCQGDSVVLMVNSFASYSWSTGAASQIIIAYNTGNYVVTVTNTFGCTASTSLQITVNPSINTSLSIDVSPADTVCTGTEVLFTAQPVNPGSTPVYEWRVNDGVTGTNSPAYSNSMLHDGDTITCTMISSVACAINPAVASVVIHIYPFPPIQVNADILSGCKPLTVHFIESSTCDGCTYQWTFGDGGLSGSKNPVHIYLNDGSYNVGLTVTYHGCASSFFNPDMITVHPNPEANFYPFPVSTSIFSPIIEFHNLSSGADAYNWFFGDGTNSSAFEPIHSYKNPGQYHIILIAGTRYGCKDSISATVVINEEYTFYAPNFISPESNGINDNFFISGIGIDPQNFYLAIYDRWGSILFETKNFNISTHQSDGWNGKDKSGKEVKSGTYTWFCSYKNMSGRKYEKAGPVTIIR